MRFKNYKNSYTKDNRIYSKNEMLDMTIREIKDRAEEFVAQYQVLGLPDEKELAGSENVVHVEAYTREDGTEVKAHWRSKPNSGSSVSNNSEDKNAELNNNSAVSEEQSETKKYEESDEYKRNYRKRENQKSIERKDPEEIAGVKKGEPMTFDEMVRSSINPSLEYENKNSGNCQCCVGAAEMRRRGYDVSAVNRDDSSLAEELAHDDFGLWLDPQTGKKCEPYEIDAKKENCSEYLDKIVQNGERYAFAYYTPEDSIIDSTSESGKVMGHVVTIDRCANGKLRYYDPQTGELHVGEDAKAYIDSWTAPPVELSANSQALRIDDKKINPCYQNDIFVPRK